MTNSPALIEARPKPIGRRMLEFAKANPGIAFGPVILLGLVLAGLFYPLPYSPVRADVSAMSSAPSPQHWFGTDVFGFDVFSRTIAASARDIPLAAAGAVVSLLLGVPLGLVASTKGRLGEFLMRALDAFQSFPLLVLAIAAVVLLGNQLSNVVVAIAIINVPRFMRLIRSEALAIRESRFIEAATAIGASKPRIMFQHMLPNVIGVILVQFSLAAANAITIIATLSFLGVGVSPPEPTWGSMVQAGARVVANGQWWAVVFPSLAIVLAVAAFNLIAEGFQALLDRQERG
jgi:peptide/nickel transport system permease protein